MIDLRIWRNGLLAAPLALIVAMFSLQEAPKPLAPDLAPDAFDTEAAALLATDLAEQFPSAEPGSEAAAGLADFVSARFAEVPSGAVAEQGFEGSVDGEDTELRNLIVTLPGSSERQIALIAQRDTADGSGATTSLASTAAMLEILSGYAPASHEKTLVFVSTDGAASGALGARRFIENYSEADLLDAAVVISQPAAPEPAPPFSIPFSTGPQSTSATLAATANAILSEEAGEPAGDPGPLSELLRLAIPSGLGEQGPLIEAGLDSVRVSSDGELPPPPSSDVPDELSLRSLGTFGRASLSLMIALDGAPSPTEHGPDAYIGLSGNLLPGWALALLALSLLLPILVACGAAIAAEASSPSKAARAVGWAGLRAVPFVLGLLTVYLFAFVGLIPSPAFPFDPAAEEVGRGGTVGVAMALVVIAATAFLLRPLLPPPASVAPVAPAAALGLAALVALAIWFWNPYLCLLIALGLQLWVPAASRLVRGRLAAFALVAAGTLPVALAVADLAGRFDAGLGVIADLILMFTGGEAGDALAFGWCALAGSGVALIAAAVRDPAPGGPQLKLGALVERGRALEERRARRRAGGQAAGSPEDGPEAPPDPGPESTRDPTPSRRATTTPAPRRSRSATRACGRSPRARPATRRGRAARRRHPGGRGRPESGGRRRPRPLRPPRQSARVGAPRAARSPRRRRPPARERRVRRAAW